MMSNVSKFRLNQVPLSELLAEVGRRLDSIEQNIFDHEKDIGHLEAWLQSFVPEGQKNDQEVKHGHQAD
jgi:hypothetical protein